MNVRVMSSDSRMEGGREGGGGGGGGVKTYLIYFVDPLLNDLRCCIKVGKSKDICGMLEGKKILIILFGFCEFFS